MNIFSKVLKPNRYLLNECLRISQNVIDYLWRKLKVKFLPASIKSLINCEIPSFLFRELLPAINTKLQISPHIFIKNLKQSQLDSQVPRQNSIMEKNWNWKSPFKVYLSQREPKIIGYLAMHWCRVVNYIFVEVEVFSWKTNVLLALARREKKLLYVPVRYRAVKITLINITSAHGLGLEKEILFEYGTGNVFSRIKEGLFKCHVCLITHRKKLP